MAYNIILFLQSLFLVCISPLFSGIIKKIKAWARGYQGPSIFQGYYDVIKTFRKGMVLSKSSSFITEWGPTFTLVAAIITAFCIPVFYTVSDSYLGNIFVVLFLLAIIKIINSLLGLDVASTFGGMGSSRELFFAVFVEPIAFLSIAVLYIKTSYMNLFSIAYANENIHNATLQETIAMVAFFALILTENARMPVDNPETHLELTMVHEAMILDISGKNYAMVELSSSIKFMIFITVFIDGFLPAGIALNMDPISLIIGILTYLIKMGILLIVISFIETSLAKFRVFRVPDLLVFGITLSILALVLSLFL